MRAHKNKLLISFILLCILAIGSFAYKPDKQDGFKNLQILPKDISEDSLDKVMHGFNHALGVHCNFCHARSKDTTQRWPDFASDEKPEKNIARHMMRMTTYINANYFNFENSTRADTIAVVKCITCHRGNAHPEEVMNVPEEEHEKKQ